MANRIFSLQLRKTCGGGGGVVLCNSRKKGGSSEPIPAVLDIKRLFLFKA